MASQFHRVGRPKLPSVHTTRGLSIRFTEAEREALEAHAENAKASLAAFVRDVLENAGVLKLPRSRR